MRAAFISVLVFLSFPALGQSFSFPGGLARGVPPSVTSIGASHSANIPASITSLRSVPLCCDRAGRPFRHGVRLAFRGAPVIFAPVFLPVAVPIIPEIYDSGMDPLVAPEELARTQPVVAPPHPSTDDRYGDHYSVRRSRKAEPAEAPESASTKTVAQPEPPPPPRPQPLTVLIFRDGHKIEIQNYAISGTTLFNLSENGPHQVSLADLDLDATMKANNERGISFHLPNRS